jgi:hypothetical protein
MHTKLDKTLSIITEIAVNTLYKTLLFTQHRVSVSNYSNCKMMVARFAHAIFDSPFLCEYLSEYFFFGWGGGGGGFYCM